MVCGSPLSQIAKLQGDNMQHDQEIKKIQEQFDEDLATLLGKYEQDMCDLLGCDNYAKNDWFRLQLDYKVTSKAVWTEKFSITLISKK
jgi:hypothetical protein